MKTKLFKHSVPLFLLLLFISTGHSQVTNGDFSTSDNGNPPLAQDWESGYTRANLPISTGHIYYVNQTVAGVGPNDGRFIFVDGERDAGTVFLRQTGNFSAGGNTTLTFMANARAGCTQTIEARIGGVSQGNPVTVNNTRGAGWWPYTIALDNPANGDLELITTTGGTTNDFGIDDIELCTSDNLFFTINNDDSFNNPLILCETSPLILNMYAYNGATSYFVSIKDVATQIEHMRFLTPAEINNMLNFDLNDFAASPAFSTLDPLWTPSNQMVFEYGKCYEIKVAVQTPCEPWVATIQTICFGESCAISANYTFKYNSELPRSANTVQFTDTSTGDPTAWFWDFGDGNTSNLQNPTHEYASAGPYSVTLLIYKITACGDVCCDVIQSSLVIEKSSSRENTKPSSTDLNNTPEQELLSIQPNPVKQSTKVSFYLSEDKTIQLSIYDNFGRTVRTIVPRSNMKKGPHQLDLNTKSLSSGIYFLILYDGNEKQVERFIVD
ncbi:PKD domain-containing protein [Winogradskyella sp.]|uniref:PKD domain-containing protein n=1 Tax=Winogradskyella sp. TaxID=1883156 RepID=UPI003BACBFF9